MPDYQQAQESVPYEILLDQAERALYEAVGQNLILRGKIEVRDRVIADKDRRIGELLARPVLAVEGGRAVPADPMVDQHDHGESDV